MSINSLFRMFASTIVAAAFVIATVPAFADDLNPQPLPPGPPPELVI
jgi:hypothetical protein